MRKLILFGVFGYAILRWPGVFAVLLIFFVGLGLLGVVSEHEQEAAREALTTYPYGYTEERLANFRREMDKYHGRPLDPHFQYCISHTYPSYTPPGCEW